MYVSCLLPVLVVVPYKMFHITHKAVEVGDLEEELFLEAGLEGAGAVSQEGTVEEMWAEKSREC